MKKNIILIGFMGTGKTAVGKALKKISEFPLIDTDELIEEQANSSISNIFKLHGEEYFRNLESAVCKRLDKYSNTIIRIMSFHYPYLTKKGLDRYKNKKESISKQITKDFKDL